MYVEHRIPNPCYFVPHVNVRRHHADPLLLYTKKMLYIVSWFKIK